MAVAIDTFILYVYNIKNSLTNKFINMKNFIDAKVSFFPFGFNGPFHNRILDMSIILVLPDIIAHCLKEQYTKNLDIQIMDKVVIPVFLEDTTLEDFIGNSFDEIFATLQEPSNIFWLFGPKEGLEVFNACLRLHNFTNTYFHQPDTIDMLYKLSEKNVGFGEHVMSVERAWLREEENIGLN